MFTIDSEATVRHYPEGTTADPEDSGTYIHTETELAALIGAKPGEFAVRLWNNLPGVTPIRTPKFRNRATAVERIWKKLCELFPDAVPSEEMPKAKESKHAVPPKPANQAQVARSRSRKTRVRSSGSPKAAPEKNGRKSAWAEELTTELRKRFNPGQDFNLEDVYKLIPGFQRKHKENHHIAARLRTTLAQDLRGAGVVKSLKRGQYRMA